MPGQNEKALEDKLILTLEFITEGSRAVVPSELSRELYSTEKFHRGIEKARLKYKHCVQGPGIQGIGIGEKIKDGYGTGECALRVYVEKKKIKSKVRNRVSKKIRLPEIGECETDVIEIGRIHQESFRSRVRPAMPGCSVGHFNNTAGTFGCLVRKNGHSAGVYILSNAHVLANGIPPKPGDDILQPGPSHGGVRSTDVIGKLDSWIAFNFTSSGFPNLVDAAIAKVNKRSVDDRIRLIGAPPAGVSHTLRRGMRVRKVGCISDLTSGVINDIHFRTSMKFSRPSGRRSRVGFRDQVLCTRYTTQGDSGSAVLNDRDRIVGLHFAGSPSVSIFNRIGHVFNALNITLA